jgi:hypothetical protein
MQNDGSKSDENGGAEKDQKNQGERDGDFGVVHHRKKHGQGQTDEDQTEKGI